MITRRSAPALLTVGLLLCSLGGFALCVEATALDAGRVAGTSRRMLEAQPVGAAMRRRAGAALASAIPPGTPIDAAGLARATDDLLREPAFVSAFAGALDGVYRHAFDGSADPIVLDPVAVRTAIVAALATVDPGLPAFVAPGAAATVTVDAGEIPDVRGYADALRMVARVGGALGALLVAIGVAMYERRVRAVARIGRWAIGAGLGILLMFWLVPEYVLPIVGGWTEVAGVVLAAGNALVVPGIVITTLGVVLAVGANRVMRLERDHTLAVIPRAPMRHATADDRSWQAHPRV